MFISKQTLIATVISPLISRDVHASLVRSRGLESSGCDECTLAGKLGQSHNFGEVEICCGYDLIVENLGNDGSTIKFYNDETTIAYGTGTYSSRCSTATEFCYYFDTQYTDYETKISFQETTNSSEHNTILAQEGWPGASTLISFTIGCVCPIEVPTNNPSSNPSALPEDETENDGTSTGGDNDGNDDSEDLSVDVSGEDNTECGCCIKSLISYVEGVFSRFRN